MTEEYTIEQFAEDFEDAQTPDAKNEVILKLLDSDIDVVDNKEIILEYRAQIKDLKEQLDIEASVVIDIQIEQGFVELYTCTKSVNEFVEGSRYYVQIDDVRSKYIESFGDDIPEAMKDYFNGIKPLIWVVTDKGIGTLKYKVLVTDFDFSEHFNK
jgi:hypothetical protein